MTGYIIRRLLWMIPVLFFVATITFFLMHAVPGGPWDAEKKLPPQALEAINRKYNLDKPLMEQYLIYLRNIIRGDLGISFRGDVPVRDRIADGWPITATLGIAAFVIATSVGVTLGTLAALRQNGVVDYLSVVFATAGASMPSFVIATFLIFLLAVQLGWVPIIAWREPLQIFTEPKVALLPVITLSLGPMAILTRLTRASVLEVVRQDYIRTARAKGLREHVVVIRHLIKNALIPVLTLLGPLLVALVTGSFIVEFIFALPGIGKEFVNSVQQRDYGMIMGTTLFYATLVVFANLVVDLLYGIVDPRIRYS